MDDALVDFDMNAPEDTGRIRWNITQEQEEENNTGLPAEAEHCRRKIEKFQPAVEALPFWTYHEGSGAYDGCFV